MRKLMRSIKRRLSEWARVRYLRREWKKVRKESVDALLHKDPAFMDMQDAAEIENLSFRSDWKKELSGISPRS